MPIDNMPEGFAELLQYLSRDPARSYKASEIQAALQSEFQFTSGKITGIIYRAVERGVINKVSRSIYRLRGVNSGNTSNTLSLCKNEVLACISKIESIVGQRITEMLDDEIRETRCLLKKLKELSQ